MNRWLKPIGYASLILILSALGGCQVLTVQEDAVHFRAGQKVRIIGPLNNGQSYVVLAVEDERAPPHAWNIEPYIATLQGPGDYVLNPVVSGAAHSPGNETHAIHMTVTKKFWGGLEVEMSAEDHTAGGGSHGGSVHLW